MAEYFATPDGYPVGSGSDFKAGEPLQDAVSRLKAGDILTILPGVYREPVRINCKGTAEAPITIIGQDLKDILFDNSADAPTGPNLLTSSRGAFMSLEGAEYVRLVNLAFDKCHPVAILLRGVNNIEILNCNFSGSRYAIRVTNGTRDSRTTNITVAGCNNIGDPEHDLWSGRVSWHDVKGQFARQKDEGERRGAFFQSRDIAGNVSITNCTISHTFNGVQFLGNPTYLEGNANIFVADCDFSFIRDNAVEPEYNVNNLWVIDNTFYNVHGTFSLDWVNGKNWYFFGNTILNNQRPGRPHQANTGGKIYKFHKIRNTKEEVKRTNFISAFNSVQSRGPYLQKGNVKNWTHVNNALSTTLTGPDSDPKTPLIAKEMCWDKSMRFEGDACDHPDFPKRLQDQKKDVDGTYLADGTFEPPALNVAFAGRAGEWDGKLIPKEATRRVPSIHLLVPIPEEEKPVKLEDRSIDLPAGLPIGAPTPAPLRKVFEATRDALVPRLPPPPFEIDEVGGA